MRRYHWYRCHAVLAFESLEVTSFHANATLFIHIVATWLEFELTRPPYQFHFISFPPLFCQLKVSTTRCFFDFGHLILGIFWVIYIHIYMFLSQLRLASKIWTSHGSIIILYSAPTSHNFV